MAELQGLQLNKAEFDRRDTAIFAVAVDPVDDNARVVEQLGLGYQILADPELAAVDAYGVRHDDAGPDHPIARPASFLIDKQGVIRWRDLTENYRYRPRPETILTEIDRLN
jgi:peroxiredoxin